MSNSEYSCVVCGKPTSRRLFERQRYCRDHTPPTFSEVWDDFADVTYRRWIEKQKSIIMSALVSVTKRINEINDIEGDDD